MTAMSQPMRLLTSHDTAEWYTPPVYVEMARTVMRAIDCDPASAALPQSWIKAATWYDAETNGLLLPWKGRVWLNPPYGITNGKSNQAVWAKKLSFEYRCGGVSEAILLVNSTHGYAWYEELWRQFPVCCVRERIRFVKPDGTQGAQAKRGQTFVYLGSRVDRFRAVFSEIGRIIFP